MLTSSVIIRGVIGIALTALPLMTPSVNLINVPEGDEIVFEIPVREEAMRTLKVTVTAYSSTPDQTDSTPFITANGQHVRDGIIAANFLPFGTRVRFPELYGDKVFTVEDRMHPRFSKRADIWMETRQEAVHFGLKRGVTLEVLPKARALALGE